MSFDELKKSDYSPKKKEISIKVGDKELKFVATECTYLQRLHLAAIQQSGEDSYSQLIVYSITDEQGKHMTSSQAQSLSPEHQEIFFVAAASVNSQLEEKKS